MSSLAVDRDFALDDSWLEKLDRFPKHLCYDLAQSWMALVGSYLNPSENFNEDTRISESVRLLSVARTHFDNVDSIYQYNFNEHRVETAQMYNTLAVRLNKRAGRKLVDYIVEPERDATPLSFILLSEFL